MKQTDLRFPDLELADGARVIHLADRIVPYVLRRAKRRTIGLTIDHRGLRINAPQRSTISEIEGLIHQHEQWVTKKLDEWKTRRIAPPLAIVDGVKIPYLGDMLEIRLAIGRHPPLWNEANANAPVLTLFLRTPVQAAFFLEKALRDKAGRLFYERLKFYAAAMTLPVVPLALSAAKTRWGSCSKRSGIRLNWRLIHFPLAVIDYVVIHELAHLREMNHSPRYWKIVEEICPEYRERRADLKQLSAINPTW